MRRLTLFLVLKAARHMSWSRDSPTDISVAVAMHALVSATRRT